MKSQSLLFSSNCLRLCRKLTRFLQRRQAAAMRLPSSYLCSFA